ncbi:MAG: hypothetical protein J6P98_06645, partial [Clostridia bacterium]|nr:hypothetical protein [Clostridia bacterium]
MKQFIKTVLALAIAAAMLPGLVSCGTKGPSAADTEVFERFMQAIVGGDYSAAYDCLSRECTQPKQEEGETVIGAEEEEEGAYISREDFTARYENIFGALGLNSVEYEKTGARTEEGASVIGYMATYHTTLAGDLVNEFEMTVVPEGEESRVLWAPSLIFPEMEQGDTVRLFRTAAKRGDIVASGDLLAETVTTWAVKAVKAEIKNAASFAEAAAEIIPIEAEEVLEKLNGSSSEKVLLYSCNEGGLSGDAREAIDALEGAELDMAYGTGRVYPQGDVMAHAVGYIGYASAEEAEKLNEGRTEMDGL